MLVTVARCIRPCDIHPLSKTIRAAFRRNSCRRWPLSCAEAAAKETQKTGVRTADTTVVPTPTDAWNMVHQQAKPDDLICITGSFLHRRRDATADCRKNRWGDRNYPSAFRISVEEISSRNTSGGTSRQSVRSVSGNDRSPSCVKLPPIVRP